MFKELKENMAIMKEQRGNLNREVEYKKNQMENLELKSMRS